ncbi:hypothetical protein NRIC_00690 [Enterococcus florum]|uniref:Uncharacterized protein n=1 Tax=Enterococcus florum TaxID=2480627 RepID=A0A4P5P8B6_9ENTE|nr:hypothetical protein [Enterococcus florum]GCF92178.1 hypothetical protein NRIC_00690 [Enterococcus florum]
MSKPILKQCIYVFFLIPYIHLILLIDFHLHSLFGFIVSLLLAGGIGFYARRNRHMKGLLIGNLFNIGMSYLLTFLKKDLFFLRHLTYPYFVVTALIFLFIIAQLTGSFWGSFFQKK